MIGNSMSGRSRQAKRRALWSAASAAILILMAPAARAQFFFGIFEPPAVRVAHQLEVEGYDVRGLVRRGDVYVADVVAQGGDRERLVIDARTTRIVERFPSVATRWRDDRYGYGRDREDPDSWDAPRPPLAIQQQRRDEVARTDPFAKPYGEDGMNGPPTSTFEVDKAKPKPHVVKRRPAPAAPVAKDAPSAPPATEVVVPTPTPNPAALATTPPNAPAAESQKPVSPTAKDQEETPSPTVDAKPAGSGKPVAEAKPEVEPRSVIQTKPATEASPATVTKPIEAKPVTETKPVAEVKATAPRPEKKPKAVNDVPVNPLD